MTAKNPQLADKIIIREQVGGGIYFSDDTATPILGVVEGGSGEVGLALELDHIQTGSIITNNLPLYIGGVTTVTGAGAIDTNSSVVAVVTTGADALTLGDGNQGQFMYIYMKTDGGDGTLTPTNLLGGTTITFDDVGDTAQLFFDGSDWVMMGGSATLA